MRIEAYVAGHCENNGKPMQKAACAVVLHFYDDSGRSSRREFSFALGNSTKNQADLQGIRLALMCIRRRFHKECPIQLFHNSHYAATVLGAREKEHKKNTELIGEVFKTIDSCLKLKIIKSSDMERAVELSKITANSQKSLDTGTIRDE